MSKDGRRSVSEKPVVITRKKAGKGTSPTGPAQPRPNPAAPTSKATPSATPAKPPVQSTPASVPPVCPQPSVPPPPPAAPALTEPGPSKKAQGKQARRDLLETLR